MTTTPTSPRRQARASPRAGEAEHGASTRRARGMGVVGAPAGAVRAEDGDRSGIASQRTARGQPELVTLAAEREQGEGEAQDAGGRATPRGAERAPAIGHLRALRIPAGSSAGADGARASIARQPAGSG